MRARTTAKELATLLTRRRPHHSQLVWLSEDTSWLQECQTQLGSVSFSSGQVELSEIPIGAYLIYQERYLRLRIVPNENVDPQLALASILETRPGVQLEGLPAPHPRGGFSIGLIVPEGSEEKTLNALNSVGLQPVL